MRSAFSRRRRHLGQSHETTSPENTHQRFIGGERDGNDAFFQPQALYNGTRTMEAEESEALSTYSKTVEEEEAQALSTSTMEEEEAQALSTSTMEEEEAQALSTSTMEEEEAQALSTSTMEEEEAQALSTSTMEEEEAQALSTSTMEEEEAQALSTSTMEEEEAQALSTSTMEEEEAQALSTSTMEEESETACEKCSKEDSTATITQTATPETETTTPANHCAIAKADFTSIPSGKLTAGFRGNKFGAAFRMNATMHSNVPCSSKNGEYRQYVKGYFRKNGRNVTHPLCGTALSSTTYQEDCGISNGKVLKYGYRSNKFATSYFDSPDQITGSRFNGYDAPGIRTSSGDSVEINLQFIGKLVDVSNGRTLKTSSWSVEGSGVAP